MSDFEVCPVGTVARLAAAEAERDALRADILFELLSAANYIDTLGGDSKSYRVAIAKAKGGGNG